MKPLVAEWIAKAENDFLAAQKLMRSRKTNFYDAVCFHSQQCAEKYLKALLEADNRVVPKIHNLIALLDMCQTTDPSLEMLRADLTLIDRYSVQVRYPGASADKDDAKAALKATVPVRETIRLKLGI